ncbi:hypothetical protein [Tardiphaga sp.]|uniref:hypothetical protein n=1 Tax=Tardiphaga sp. TaxID=1926292 RepID=UPI002620D0E5|nr:hypothetical protein [Tardiphaga sp.]
MAKLVRSQTSKTTGFVVGHAGFAKISAVEGIELTGLMKKRITEANQKRSSDAERREAIIRAHRKT